MEALRDLGIFDRIPQRVNARFKTTNGFSDTVRQSDQLIRAALHDSAAYQLATVSGDASNGFAASLTVGIAA